MTSDAVSDVLPDDRIAVALDVRLHGGGDVKEAVSLSCLRDTLEKALAGHVNQVLRLRGDRATRECGATVAVITADERAHVHADDIAFFEAALPRNAVYDFLVDADTDTRGESVVVVEGRHRALSADELGHFPVNRLRGDAGFNQRSGKGASRRRDLPGAAHEFDFMRGLDDNPLFLSGGHFQAEWIWRHALYASKTLRIAAVVASTVD